MKKITEDWYESIQKKYGKNKHIVYHTLKTFGNDKIMSNELSNLSFSRRRCNVHQGILLAKILLISFFLKDQEDKVIETAKNYLGLSII